MEDMMFTADFHWSDPYNGALVNNPGFKAMEGVLNHEFMRLQNLGADICNAHLDAWNKEFDESHPGYDDYGNPDGEYMEMIYKNQTEAMKEVKSDIFRLESTKETEGSIGAELIGLPGVKVNVTFKPANEATARMCNR